MRNLILVSLVSVIVLWAGSALAEEETSLYCISMPWCCEFSCVVVDIDCDCWCPSNSPLTVEFLDRAGMVLGWFEVPNYCGLCDEYYASLDKAVSAGDVCSIRLRKPDEACACLWMSLKVLCGDACCAKWYKVFKGDVWCWQPVPVPPVPVPEPVVEMPPPPPPPVAVPEPEPQMEYDYFPAQVEEEQEVIVVEGRG